MLYEVITGGGLEAFLNANEKARIYLHKNAFDNHYSQRNEKKAYIGLNQDLKNNERLIFVDEYLKIDKELELYSAIETKELLSSANNTLFVKKNENYEQDDFIHEQNLIITSENDSVLIAGCAHSGIVNIVKKAEKLKNKIPEIVIGGFHLYNPSANKSEPIELIEKIGNYFLITNSKYYTCHCTGIEAFEYLQNT